MKSRLIRFRVKGMSVFSLEVHICTNVSRLTFQIGQKRKKVCVSECRYFSNA